MFFDFLFTATLLMIGTVIILAALVTMIKELKQTHKHKESN